MAKNYTAKVWKEKRRLRNAEREKILFEIVEEALRLTEEELSITLTKMEELLRTLR